MAVSLKTGNETEVRQFVITAHVCKRKSDKETEKHRMVYFTTPCACRNFKKDSNVTVT